MNGADQGPAIPLSLDNRAVGCCCQRPSRTPWIPIHLRALLARRQPCHRADRVGAVVIALALGGFLAFTMTRSLRELTEATIDLAHGKLGRQVKVRSKDELGKLASSFNQMSQDLERSTQVRRQMTADIAHDLRSPLTVITGYIEALRDGVLKPTPARFETMYSEAQQLKRLVEDLRTLSLADAGELPMQVNE